MKIFILFVTILVVVPGCNQEENSNARINTVYIDGKELEIKTTNTADSQIEYQPDTSYLHNQKIKGLAGSGIVQIIENPIFVIDSIFNDYVQYQESTDSEENKRTITTALKQLDSNLTVNDLIVVINVWMYYDPTDFSARMLTENVLIRNLDNGIQAIEQRKINKRDWETEDSAPYSELDYLLKKLKEMN